MRLSNGFMCGRNFSQVALWMSALILLIHGSAAIDQRCTACRSVSDAFYRRLKSERERNHLDMRHRLDAEGKRYGKVIDYKVSELRVSELLDNLCEDMDHFAWGSKPNAEGEHEWKWFRVNGASAADTATLQQAEPTERKSRSRELKTYCYSLIEQTEDDLSEYLVSGSKNHDDLEALMCTKLVQHCDERELSAAAVDTPAEDNEQEEQLSDEL